LLYENLLATAYLLHPYRNPIIGWNTDIANLTLEKTEAFLHAYYAPVNTVIALVGDVDFSAAVQLVEHYFGDLPPGQPLPPVVDREPEQVGERRLHIPYDAEPRLVMAFHKPTLPDQEDYVFDLIDTVLSDGPSSRLYRALVLERQVAACFLFRPRRGSLTAWPSWRPPSAKS
jgi:predicted Zn-dependent peptidase